MDMDKVDRKQAADLLKALMGRIKSGEYQSVASVEPWLEAIAELGFPEDEQLQAIVAAGKAERAIAQVMRENERRAAEGQEAAGRV